MLLLVGEAGIPHAKVRVRDHGVHSGSRAGFEVRNAEITTVGQKGGFAEILGMIPESFQILLEEGKHHGGMALILTFATRDSSDDDLVLMVDDGLCVEALDGSMRGLHLGGVWIGDVAFDLFVLLADPFFCICQEPVDLVGLLLQPFDLALPVIQGRVVVVRALVFAISLDVVVHEALDLLLKGCLLLAELRKRAAPFLGGVAGQFAAIEGEEGAAKEVHLLTNHQHLNEEGADLVAHGGDELGDGGMVRRIIAGHGDENDVLVARPFDAAGADKPSGITEKDDLEQDLGIDRRAAGLVVAEACVKGGEVEPVFDDVVNGVFEGARDDLLFEGDGKHQALFQIRGSESWHIDPPSLIQQYYYNVIY